MAVSAHRTVVVALSELLGSDFKRLGASISSL